MRDGSSIMGLEGTDNLEGFREDLDLAMGSAEEQAIGA